MSTASSNSPAAVPMLRSLSSDSSQQHSVWKHSLSLRGSRRRKMVCISFHSLLEWKGVWEGVE